MPRFLITQSLLSAWGYMFDCFEGYEDEARESFVRTLNREKDEPTEAMLNGIEFENEVYKAAHNQPREPHPKWENGIQKVASIIRNAPNQVKVSRSISVNGYDILVYGILDALKAGIIYDVKFSNKGFGSVDCAGKYLNSPQHPAYLFMVPEAEQFTYLLSDGEDLYTETYTRDNITPIDATIGHFLAWLERNNLIDVYKEKWQSLERG